MQTQLEASGMMLVPVQTNLIDVIWDDRPAPPCNIIQPHALKYSGDCEQSFLILLSCMCYQAFVFHTHSSILLSGKTSKQKVHEVRIEMAEKGASLLVVTALDEIACKYFCSRYQIIALFNIVRISSIVGFIPSYFNPMSIIFSSNFCCRVVKSARLRY